MTSPASCKWQCPSLYVGMWHLSHRRQAGLHCYTLLAAGNASWFQTDHPCSTSTKKASCTKNKITAQKTSWFLTLTINMAILILKMLVCKHNMEVKLDMKKQNFVPNDQVKPSLWGGTKDISAVFFIDWTLYSGQRVWWLVIQTSHTVLSQTSLFLF